MRRSILIAAFAVPGALLAFACGTVSTPGAGGSCPCTIGNAGIQYTLGCGQSGCLALNGSVTGYRCESDGAHEDPTACSAGDDGGGAPDGPAGSESGPAADGGAGATDAPVVPDATPPADTCESTSPGGTCASPLSCHCPASSTCSFACGAGDAGAFILCSTFSTCGVACAGTCSVDCNQATACTADVAGGNGSVTCSQTQSCTATVAAGGTVDCAQAGTCDVTCEGACTVSCSQATSCRVSCAGGAADCNVSCGPAAATTCPDGTTRVCGAGSC